MRPDIDLEPVWSGHDIGIRLAVNDRPIAPPNRVLFTATSISNCWARLSAGSPVKRSREYVTEKIFRPLGMTETMYLPPRSLISRIAPTEIVKGNIGSLAGRGARSHGALHGGVAGHAGLFSTAADLSKFAEMMLGNGRRNRVRIFSPLTVKKFTSPQTPPDQPVLRGLGWDIDSAYSTTRGDLFPVGSFGHTGFTGTSMWMDPATDSYRNSAQQQRSSPFEGLHRSAAKQNRQHRGRGPGYSRTCCRRSNLHNLLRSSRLR